VKKVPVRISRVSFMSKMSLSARAAILAALLFMSPWQALSQARRFEKVSPHCYVLAGENGSPNMGAVVTDDGILVVNPPAEPELTTAVEALKKAGSKPIRWFVCTDQAREQAGGALALSKQGALMITSAGLRESGLIRIKTDDKPADRPPDSLGPSLAFARQLRIFTGELEIQIQAPEREWHQGGDAVVFVPAEKVLMVGDLYSPGNFPAFEHEQGTASAVAWLETLKQVIDMVPLLKPAMPQPKPEPEKEGEEPKTLEELVVVIPAVGPLSNLQEMKDLLASGQKIRVDVARAVAQKRNRETFVDLPMFGPYRGLGNLDSFATRLFDELKAGRPSRD
jgi:glyoxylase-like metal-dependent hydrolase (beta-lactamase superfamily II)